MKFIEVTEIRRDVIAKTNEEEGILLNSDFIKKVRSASDHDRTSYGAMTELELVAGGCTMVKESPEVIGHRLANVTYGKK